MISEDYFNELENQSREMALIGKDIDDTYKRLTLLCKNYETGCLGSVVQKMLEAKLLLQDELHNFRDRIQRWSTLDDT
jgi:hypothetical protein